MLRPAKIKICISPSLKHLKSKPHFCYNNVQARSSEQREKKKKEHKSVWWDRTAREQVSLKLCMFSTPSYNSLAGMNGKRIVTISVHVGDETLVHTYCLVGWYKQLMWVSRFALNSGARWQFIKPCKCHQLQHLWQKLSNKWSPC